VGRPAADGIRSASGNGLEAAARQARYRFLTETAEKLGACYVAVAHTADDQAETILHRILRGTGIGGLAGMGRVRRLSPATTLVRPLLGFRRLDLRSYLDDIGQPYRLDASNLDPQRTRNRIRHQLLPELAARFNPNVVEALLRLGGLAGEVRSAMDSFVEQLAERAVREATSCEARVELGCLRGESRYLVRELFMAIWRRQGWPLRDMGLSQWDLLADMAQQAAAPQTTHPQRYTLPGRVFVETGPGVLRLRRLG
jgi:tRNA(Ile)-lysidine synthase